MPARSSSIEHQSRHNLQRIGVGLAVAGILFDLTGCATPEAKPVDTTSQLPPTPDKPTASPSTGETSSSAEFTPAATGKYSPEALAKLVNNPEQLAKVFEITGNTPEEIAKSSTETLNAFLMSGTTEDQLSPYRVDGTVFGQHLVDYFKQADAYYQSVACEAMNGRPCTFTEGITNVHQIILSVYGMNHANSEARGEDFMLGADKILDVKVLEGSVKSGALTLQYDTLWTNNYEASAAKDVGGKYTPLLKDRVGQRRITQSYVREGDHWNVTGEGTTEVIS